MLSSLDRYSQIQAKAMYEINIGEPFKGNIGFQLDRSIAIRIDDKVGVGTGVAGLIVNYCGSR